MISKVEGIIIRSTDYGEGNKILTLYTKELGKIGVMARGAKKTKSRLSAVSQLFIQGYFVLYHGSGLGSLTQGDVIHSFRGIHQDIFKTAWSAYIVELIDKVIEEREKNPFLYQLLESSLKQIEEGKDPEIVTRIFEIQFLNIAGTRPETRWCSYCHRNQFPLLAFSVKEGGLLCEGCLAHDPHAHILSPASIRLLQTFSTMDINKLGKVEVKQETRKQLAMIFKLFIEAYIGVTIKSRNFLDQISQLEILEQQGEKGDQTNDKEPQN